MRCRYAKGQYKYLYLESNEDHEGRSPMLYPLSYTGETGVNGVEPLFPESESGALTVMRSACNIVTEIPRARIKDPGYAQNGRFVAARFIH